ncbi:YcgN family cysteine cluster protein [Varunaivibrio sulfuroxidans]|nr:YcgN family cysteine cluster protein [Varunaivibrio sulfuroxidans]WES32196.1 YcgN family cysteine cluster protein [Varunaivibrio sulfuroxidans]
MSAAEWESLCDGCGKCCLEKLEDADTGEIAYTEVACQLLDVHSCRCANYAERTRFVPDCIKLTAGNVATLAWMPSTCAYRLLAEGRDLPSWHPLRSGARESVHRAGASVRGRAVSAVQAGDLEDHIVDWPR